MNKLIFGLLGLVVLCGSCNKDESVPQGSVILSASVITDVRNGRILEDQVSSVIISVEMDGELVLSNYEVDVYGFQSEPVLLEIGDYEVTKFLLLNESGEVIYATPMEGSALGTLVEKPLPVQFTISADEVNNLSLEVIPTSSIDPEDLGYAALGYEIVPTVQILVSSLVQNGESTSFEVVDLKVTADGVELFTEELSDSINVVTLRSDFTTIDIEFILGDSLSEVRSLSAADLLTYRTVPLTVVFKIAESNVMTFRPGPTTGNDALVSLLMPDNNYGDYEDIHLYSWTVNGSFETHHVLIDFDLSDLPENAIIDAAYLSLFYNNTSVYRISYHPHNSGNNTFSVNRVLEDWNEMTVTWNNKPEISEEDQVIVENRPGDEIDYDNIEVTELVKDMYANPSSNHGLLIKHDVEAVYKVAFFASSEHPNESLRPKLEVYYH
ncbi:DNRLRE domain-containing protein [Marinoscillum pacificum]|uniref:DNRLRE domain-containing protein n=1 Tax=Marinoscillum pacificum TaxID=392723 RepID=UPI0021584C9A|nr:DNRLRE domain-containing protein [Marinoscillum pacificum]